MPAVDTLLTLLLEDNRNIAARMTAAGFSEDETRGAWNYARQAGYTEATGLGQDRLTESGRSFGGCLSDRCPMRGADKATDNSPIRGVDPIRAATMPSGDIDER